MIEMLERGGDFMVGRIRDRAYIEGVDMNSSEGDSGFNYPTGNKNNSSHENVQFYDDLSKNPQFRDSTVCWERFLPLRSLKVLLVENDDSTRHLVRSLLQNCSYEVSAVSNGMQAWNILEDSSNHIDIVLTEVVMPLLNGVGLLSKIVNHNILNNIPVIMMSSHDSMDVVFKCLSKGAVDFLVKPIRKNELKNLWQHVWRKCHSSSGSGSEAGAQIKTSEGTKSTACLENNTGSNDEHENGSTEPAIRPSSENGSGTQNSCTRKYTGTKSHDTESPRNQFSDALDMTYARIFQTELGIMNTSRESAKVTKKYHEMDSKYVDLSMGKDLQIQMPMRSETPCEHHREDIFLQRNNDNELPNLQSKLFYTPQKEDTSENLNFRLQGGTLNISIPKRNCTETAVLNGTITPPTEDTSLTTNTKYREMPSVDLNFKEQGGAADVDESISDEQNILRHSNLSAFSKYRNESSSLNQAPNGNIRSCFLVNSPTMPTFLPHSASTPRLYSEGHGDVNDENLTALCASQNSNEKSVPLPTLRYFDQNFQTLHNDDPHQYENHISGKTDNWRIKTIQSDPMSSGLHVQIQHHHHHYHNHVRNFQTHKRGECHDLEDPLKNMNSGALQSGSSHALSGPVQSNATNYSLNGSASGSNHGSNDHGSRPGLGNNALNTEMPNLEIDDMITGNINRERLDETHENDCSLRQRESVLKMFFQNEKGADKIEDEDKNGSCTKNMESNAQQSGASNVIGIPSERNSAKCSMNGSISKTSHGSNRQTISSSILNLGIPHLEYKNMISENSEGTLNGKNNGNGGEDDRFAQREAALIKFRQKRKDRCFEKKVRYQSRKKLADQRPRVRGQFVRQARRGEDMGECSSSVFGDDT